MLPYSVDLNARHWSRMGTMKTQNTNSQLGNTFATLLIVSMVFGLCLLSAPQTVKADTQATREAIKPIQERLTNTVKDYLGVQTQAYPGKVNITVTPIDNRIRLADCDGLELFTVQGSRLWGKTNVGVRCNQPKDGSKPWTIYVQADVRVWGDYAVAAAPISQGKSLTAHDIVMQSGDLTRLPNGVLTDSSMVVGKVAALSMAVGTVLRPELLKSPTVIQQGQTVRVSSGGPGFNVSTEGLALTNAYDGQVVQVKVASGQTVSGIAKYDGKVEIVF